MAVDTTGLFLQSAGIRLSHGVADETNRPNIPHKKEVGEFHVAGNKSRLAEIQHLTKTVSWRYNLKSGLLSAPPALYQLTGFDKNCQPNYRNLSVLIHESDRSVFQQAIRQILKTGLSFSIAYKIATPFGEKEIALYSYCEYGSDGKPSSLFGILQDISDYQRMEKDLKNAEQRWHTVFFASPVPKWIYSLDGLQILEVNKAAIDQYGYSRNEFLALSSTDICNAGTVAMPVDTLHIATEMKGSTVNIYNHKIKSGQTIRVEIHADRIFFQNKECVVVASKNITEQENIVNMLVDREAKLDDIQKMAKLGYWEFFPDIQLLHCSREVYAIWNIDENMPLNLQMLLTSVHPADHSAFKENLEAAIKGEIKLNTEHRIILPGGAVKWVNETGRSVKNKAGQIISYNGTVQDITERKLAAEAVRKSNERFELIGQAVNDAMWESDISNNTLWANSNHQEFYGLSISDPVPDDLEWKQRLHPRERDTIYNSFHQAIDGTTNIWQGEFQLKKNNDSWISVYARTYIERDIHGKASRLVGSMVDITKRKKEEQHLKLLESVITNTNDAVLVTDADKQQGEDMRIVYVNEAFTRMTGYTSGEVIGKTPGILRGPGTDKADIEKLQDAISKWQPCEITMINYKKSGEPFWINFTINPVADEQGSFTHWIAIQRDITAAKLAEIHLNELNAHLNEQAKALAISNNELKQFAFVASHDLQEPLRMVTNFLSLLEKRYGSAIDENGKKYIQLAVDGAKRMRRIIMDLLEFSMVGKAEGDISIIDLNMVINEIQFLYARKVKEKNAVILVADLPKIPGHHTPYRQIFQNLISNALKYSAETRPVKIEIQAIEHQDHWHFSVADNGIGIREEYFNKIFIIFQRLHNNDEYSGTGIGLALTKKIVDNFGGNIWLTSTEGQGATFHFTIPKVI